MQGHNLRGLIIGDKVGEMHFLNIDNLEKLPKEEVESNVAKLLYGHQQSITSIQRSMCSQYLISTDTLNKVVVNQFPNVFNIQSVNTDQKTTLKDICFIDENQVVSLSSGTDPSNSNIFVSDISSGETQL